MTLKETPAVWRRGFKLYRRRKGNDSLGNVTAVYDMANPDVEVSVEEGITFQYPRGWNTAGSVGSRGCRVEEQGEIAGGVLEGWVKSSIVISRFDRLEVDGELWEVRAVYCWPGHRQMLMQKVR